MNKTIGTNIKNLREKFGYSQATVAKFLNVSRELISYYETEERDIPVQNLNKLADLFGVELIDIIEDKSELQKVNTSFAFRAEEIDSEDLPQIAAFKKIVKNYIKMHRIETNETK